MHEVLFLGRACLDTSFIVKVLLGQLDSKHNSFRFSNCISSPASSCLASYMSNFLVLLFPCLVLPLQETYARNCESDNKVTCLQLINSIPVLLDIHFPSPLAFFRPENGMPSAKEFAETRVMRGAYFALDVHVPTSHWSFKCDLALEFQENKGWYMSYLKKAKEKKRHRLDAKSLVRNIYPRKSQRGYGVCEIGSDRSSTVYTMYGTRKSIGSFFYIMMKGQKCVA